MSGDHDDNHRDLWPWQQLIVEMNRLGMLIDLAHVTEKVMDQVLDMSMAPVIFSHSSAYTICPHKRNVPDRILKRVVSGTSVGQCVCVCVWGDRDFCLYIHSRAYNI